MYSKNVKKIIAVMSLVVAPVSVVSAEDPNLYEDSMTTVVASLVKDGLNSVAEAVKGLQASLANVSTADATHQIKTLLEEAKQTLNALAASAPNMATQETVNALRDDVVALGKTVRVGSAEALRAVANQAAEIASLKNDITYLGGQVDSAKAWVKLSVMKDICRDNEPTAFQVACAKVRAFPAAAYASAKEGIKNAGSYAKDAANNASENIKSGAAKAGSYVKTTVSNATKTASQVAKNAQEFAATTYEQVSLGSQCAFYATESKLAEMYDTVLGRVPRFGEGLTKANDHVKSAVVVGTALAVTGVVVWAVKSYLARRCPGLHKPEVPLLGVHEHHHVVVEVIEVVDTEDMYEDIAPIAEVVVLESLIAEEVI